MKSKSVFSKPDSILSLLEKNASGGVSLPRVSLWLGSEDYWKDLWVKKIANAIFPDTETTSGQIVNYDLEKHTLDTVIQECDTFGLFAETKLIRVRRCEALNAEMIEKLKTAVSGFSEQSYVIFESSVMTGNESFIQKDPQVFGQIVSFEIDNTRQLNQWIHDKFSSLGFQTVCDEAVEYLVKAFPRNLRQLSENIEKLVAYAGEDIHFRTFNPGVINAENEEVNNFKWLDSLVGGRLKECLSMTANMLSRDKGAVFPLIGLLRWQYIMLVKASGMLKSGIAGDVVCKECKIPPFKKNFVLGILKQVSPDHWIRGIQMIGECDYALKSSGRAQEVVFTHLIWNLCQKNKDMTLRF